MTSNKEVEALLAQLRIYVRAFVSAVRVEDKGEAWKQAGKIANAITHVMAQIKQREEARE